MNGDGDFGKSGQESGQENAYFALHMIWIVFAVSCFATIIGWLIWRMVIGGVFEWVLGFLVLVVLLCIMLTGVKAAVVIALEGRPKKSTIEPVPAQPRVISADRWMIVDPIERRGPL